MTQLTGRGVSPGVALGRAVIAVRDARQVRYRLAASGVERERQRLRAAREHTRVELEEISSRVSRTLGPAQAAIFAAQLLMLDDPLLTRRADELVRTERINGDWALERAIAELHALFAQEGDEWLRERAGDVADVGGRLQRNLRPGRDPLVDLVHELDPPVVIVADELPASVAAQLEWTRVAGVVCDFGSPTHHTAILMRSLGIPAVVGIKGITGLISPGQTIALDGTSGEVSIEPTDAVVARWHRRAESREADVRALRLEELRAQPATTADGVRIRLEANLEIADEVGRVLGAGAEGIGLFRSEFLLDATSPEEPSEEKQYATYCTLLDAVRPRPVTIRTFDTADRRRDLRLGGRRERFGVRGIRAAVRHDDRFVTQVRALLRAGEHGPLRILLPFVTTREELQQTRLLIADIARSLGVGGVPVGAMIEVPAAALTVDHLAGQADFLSVGTNDLIQYTLAIDRTDERLAGHYEPLAPAVLRLLRTIARASARTHCEVSVCGEMAGDPVLVAVLVGLGFRAFSMAPAAIPMVKRSLTAVDSRQAQQIARQAVRAGGVDEVQTLIAPLAEALVSHAAAVRTSERS
jgi:phosphotransferase system enzyme I (PtsI)